MSNFSQTLIAAVIVLILAVVCLGIGWLISGKNRLRKGCGMRPKDGPNSSTCPLCGGGEPCEDKKDDTADSQDDNDTDNADSSSKGDR